MMTSSERRRWELHQRGFQYSVSQAVWSAGDHTLTDHEINQIPEDIWYAFLDQLPKRVRRLREIAKQQPRPDEPSVIAAMYGVTEADVRQAEMEAIIHPLLPLLLFAKELSRQAGAQTHVQEENHHGKTH